MTDCHFYLHGESSRGRDCEFRHSWAAKAEVDAGTARECSYFRSGTCARHECKFLHPSGAAKVRLRSHLCLFV
jgi:hypothetical protein